MSNYFVENETLNAICTSIFYSYLREEIAEAWRDITTLS